MKEKFFTVVPPETVLSLTDHFDAVAVETVPLAQARNRVLGENIQVTSDLPGFSRSAMDGFAVRAAATFGASEGNPVYLEQTTAVVMGQAPAFSLGPGQAAPIPTEFRPESMWLVAFDAFGNAPVVPILQGSGKRGVRLPQPQLGWGFIGHLLHIPPSARGQQLACRRVDVIHLPVRITDQNAIG